MKIRIALDQGIGRWRAMKLMDMGYQVVVVARTSESDESWVNRAFAEGAQFAVSPDLDIPRLIENQSYPMTWINYPSDDEKHKADLVKYIDDRVKFKLNFFKDMSVQPKKKGSKWYSRYLSFIK